MIEEQHMGTVTRGRQERGTHNSERENIFFLQNNNETKLFFIKLLKIGNTLARYDM